MATICRTNADAIEGLKAHFADTNDPPPSQQASSQTSATYAYASAVSSRTERVSESRPISNDGSYVVVSRQPTLSYRSYYSGDYDTMKSFIEQMRDAANYLSESAEIAIELRKTVGELLDLQEKGRGKVLGFVIAIFVPLAFTTVSDCQHQHTSTHTSPVALRNEHTSPSSTILDKHDNDR